MEKQLTEETVREKVTEEAARKRVTDANAVVFWITLQLLTFGLMGFGWRLPVEFQKRHVNVIQLENFCFTLFTWSVKLNMFMFAFVFFVLFV